MPQWLDDLDKKLKDNVKNTKDLVQKGWGNMVTNAPQPVKDLYYNIQKHTPDTISLFTHNALQATLPPNKRIGADNRILRGSTIENVAKEAEHAMNRPDKLQGYNGGVLVEHNKDAEVVDGYIQGTNGNYVRSLTFPELVDGYVGNNKATELTNSLGNYTYYPEENRAFDINDYVMQKNEAPVIKFMRYLYKIPSDIYPMPVNINLDGYMGKEEKGNSKQ